VSNTLTSATRATALSLTCPYLAISSPHINPLLVFPIGATSILTPGDLKEGNLTVSDKQTRKKAPVPLCFGKTRREQDIIFRRLVKSIGGKPKKK
ncbi:MAG: hypothetical protein WCG75_12110, partial [Armatimonadota bacterium]